jgi:hypothetical protein
MDQPHYRRELLNHHTSVRQLPQGSQQAIPYHLGIEVGGAIGNSTRPETSEAP